MDFLHKIGVVDSRVGFLCALCGTESLNHIMLHCHFVWNIWSSIIKWWGIQQVVRGTVEGLLQWWSDWKFNKVELQIWKAIPITIFWSVWKHRNDVIFNEVQPNNEDLCEIFKVRVAMWLKSNMVGRYYSINQFVSNLQQIRQCMK